MRRVTWAYLGLLLTGVFVTPLAARADTVASLLGNFTINQFCGLQLASTGVAVHYVVVFGQLPALRELHLADADGDGVTSQAERDAYIGKLGPGFAEGLAVRVDGVSVPLRATHWTSSLPTEQGGFSLRIDVDFAGILPAAAMESPRTLEFANQNYAGRMGWHEIVVTPASGVQIFNTDAYSTSLTGGLSEALRSVPEAGPLDERTVHLNFGDSVPLDAQLLTGRPGSGAPGVTSTPSVSSGKAVVKSEGEWIARRTRELVDTISGPHVRPRVAMLALLAALLLGAVHALSPGHGKTIVGAYLIGSRGTPRHALFLGLTVTITHTLGVFALGFATLYASRYVVPERLFPILSLLSAALVLVMGIMLLIQRGRSARRALAEAHFAPLSAFQFVGSEVTAPGGARGLIFAAASSYVDATMHSHGGGPMHSHLPPGASGEQITWRSLLSLGISGGLVPCPSAMVLLLAAVALNKTAYGMLLVVAFSVGLAITLTLVGLAFLYARNRFRRPGAGNRWAHLLPLASACSIMVLGIALCVGALRSFSF
jgi:ABC-type nickel/cobalt efflux system permease component RcnA